MRVASGVGLGEVSGGSAGVPVGGIGAGVGARGSVAGVAVGVPADLCAGGGWDGLHEEKIAAAANVSKMEDALFIG